MLPGISRGIRGRREALACVSKGSGQGNSPPSAARAVSRRRAGPLGAGGGAAAGGAGGDGAGGRFRASRGGGRAGGGRRRSLPGYGWTGAARGDADRRQEPGSTPGGAGDRGGAGAGDRGDGGDGAGLAGAAQPLPRRHRDQRQDDHGRAARPPLPHAPASRSRSPATSARRSRSWSARSTPRRRSSASAPASSSRTRSPSPPSAPSSSTSRPTTSTATATSRTTWRRSCGSSPTRATTTSPSTTPTTPSLAGTDLGGCARRIAFCHGAAPDCEVAVAEGTIFYDGEPLLAVSELGLFGEHNVANAMAAAAAALAMGIDRDAVREGLRSFAGVPHRLEPVAEIGGVRFVNDSKATNVASAAVGIRAFEGGVHAILGGSEKDEPFAPLVEPLRERAAPATWSAPPAERMARELAPAVEAGVELHRCADLEDAVRRAAAAAAARRGRPALARLRQLRRLRELRSARRALPRDRRGAGDERDARCRSRAGPRAEEERSAKKRAPPAAARVQHAPDRDALPAGASAR